jgi:hypothetical protein
MLQGGLLQEVVDLRDYHQRLGLSKAAQSSGV